MSRGKSLAQCPTHSRRGLLERLFAVDRAEHSIVLRLMSGLPLPLLLLVLGPLLGPPGSALMWFVSSTTVFMSGWLGGFASGAVATIVSAAIVHHGLLPTHEHRGWPGSDELVQFVAFIAAGLLVSLLHGQLRASVRKLDQRRIEARAQARQLEETRSQLEEAQARLELALDSAHIGVWSRDLRTGRVEWDARVTAMLGVPSAIIESGQFRDFWRARVDPADAERIDALSRATGEIPRHDVVRLRLDDGRVRTIHTTALLRRHAGEPVQMVGTNRDITAEVEAEQRLRLALSRLEIAREAADIGFWRWDLDSHRIEWDRRVLDWFELTHVSHTELTYHHWLERVHPEDASYVLEAVRGARDDGRPRVGVYRIVLPGGEVRHIKSSAVLERDATGRHLALIGIHQDVTHDVVTARELGAREREVQALNRQLEERVAERTSALLDALLHAEAATRAKAAFLRNVSHELRTPLNPILGWSRLLAQSITDPEHRRHLGHIEDGGRRLLELVNDLIELTSSASDDPTHSSIDLAATIDAAISMIASAAADKGLQVVSHVDPAIPRSMSGDATRVAQVLAQLLGNALKFSASGRIQVRSTLGHIGPGFACVRFEVEDEGIGIAPEMQQHVFDAFRQVRDGSVAPAGGLGIGLALAKRAVERLDGEIGVTSVPGAGSTFWFTARFLLGPQAAIPAAAGRLYG